MNKNIENSILDSQIETLCELYEKNKFLTVIQKTKSLLKNFNFSITLLNILGMAYVKLEKFDKALESYQSALKLNPKDHLTLYNLGIVYHDTMEFDKAIFYYKFRKFSKYKKSKKFNERLLNSQSINRKSQKITIIKKTTLQKRLII